ATFDPATFYAHAERHLPRYALPALVRILAAVDVTGTLKQRKLRLVDEGYDPATVSDPLFVRDDAARSYVSLTAARLDEVRQGVRRLCGAPPRCAARPCRPCRSPWSAARPRAAPTASAAPCRSPAGPGSGSSARPPRPALRGRRRRRRSRPGGCPEPGPRRPRRPPDARAAPPRPRRRRRSRLRS